MPHPYCTECHKVTGGCAAHAVTFIAAPPGPGCAVCNWTGWVALQMSYKPMSSVPCLACSPSQGTN